MELELLAFRKQSMYYEYDEIVVDTEEKTYTFILYGDDKKKFRFAFQKHSYVELRIMKNNKKDTIEHKWTINKHTIVIKNVIGENDIDLLESLYKKYLREKKFQRIVAN